MDHEDTDERLAELQRRAEALMRAHGLAGWKFCWDRAKRRLGQCRGDTRTISLSRPLATVNSREQSIDTILHEIAHALVGVEHGHDRVWKRKVVEIGGTPQRIAHNSVCLPPSWVGHCPNCGYRQGAHRRRVLACRTCCDRFNDGGYTERFNFVWYPAK